MFLNKKILDNNFLEIQIDNNNYIEVEDFIDGIIGLKSEYTNFIKNKGGKENHKNKLFVKDIKKGSIVLEIIEEVIDNKETVVFLTPILQEFCRYLVASLNFLIEKEFCLETEEKKYDNKSLSNFVKFFNFCSNNKGNINISFFSNNTKIINNNYNYIEANAAQNICSKLMEKNNSICEIEAVELELYQARNIKYSQSGNLGIIRKLCKKPKPITYVNEEVKDNIINIPNNPFDFVFNVNIKLVVYDKNKSYDNSDNIKEYIITYINGIINKEDIEEKEFEFIK